MTSAASATSSRTPAARRRMPARPRTIVCPTGSSVGELNIDLNPAHHRDDVGRPPTSNCLSGAFPPGSCYCPGQVQPNACIPRRRRARRAASARTTRPTASAPARPSASADLAPARRGLRRHLPRRRAPASTSRGRASAPPSPGPGTCGTRARRRWPPIFCIPQTTRGRHQHDGRSPWSRRGDAAGDAGPYAALVASAVTSYLAVGRPRSRGHATAISPT